MFPHINPRQSFPALEEEMLAYWKANDTFKKSLEIREWAPEFNFYDGPPFATGTPHYGHILAGTIKDVIPRYQTMQGKFVERRFGWDCHGLPIENKVEEKMKISGKKDIEEKIGVYEFNEECRRNVFGYVDDWRQMVERTGRWVDMDNDYKTMDTDFMESVWWVFKNIYDKGYVYESYRVVPYCTRCSTPLSNFEVNQGYEDKQDKAVTVKFKVKWTASKYILAWTTTPWTLPANLGLAVGTDLQYAEILDKATGDTYVLATDRIATYYKNPEDYTLVREYPGSCLIGMEYEPILPITEGIFEGNHTDCIGVWIILKNNEGQYFLQKRTDDAPLNPGKVALFGGGMNKWEDEKDAILREVEEELDMSLERSKLQLVKYHPSINYPGKSIAIFAYETAIELPRILKEGQEILTLSSEEIFASEEATRFTKEFIQYFEGIKTGSNVLGRKAFQVVPGHHVTTDSGTGVVHIAPAYGEDDFQIGKRENLGFISHIDAVGHTTGLLSDNDVYVFDYNQIVIDRLKSEKKLVHVGTIDHSYPHCYRCHTPLIYRAISAWYVNVESMKDRMIANNAKVNWVPETIKHGRFGKWVEGARDWNISRNRYWGSAIPVWKSEDGDVQVIGSVEELYQANREFGDITKIIFVRHGESLKNTEGIIDGTDKPKFPLTEKWKQQAEKVTELLKDEDISAIYSSSFRRAQETAEIINQKYWLDIIYDDRLREVFLWKMDGMKRIEIQEEYDMEHDKYLEDWSYKIGGWESANDIKARMQDFVEEIGKKYAWKTVVVVSHADQIAVMNEYLTGKKSFWKGIELPQTGAPSTIYYHVSETKAIDLHKHFVDNIKLSKDGKTYTRIPEVLDCWFESGSMPYASKHYPFEGKEDFRFPADFIAEGLDQTRGWFYTLLILGTALFDNTPFMNVIVNGLILAEDGKKMSKSLKNYPDPNEIINKHGADALRFFMLSSQVVRAEDLRFSEAGVEETVKKVLLPLWNTYSFFTTYANIDGWSPSGTVVDYVRHGQTSLNIAQSGAVQEERTVSWGLNDHELTDEGVAQCNRLGEELRKKGAIYDVIVTTGMKRTDNTARIIAEEIGFNGEWVTEEGLRERMVDEKHEGALWSDIAREYREKFPERPIREMGLYLLAEMGVAESNDDFEARTFSAYKRILEKYAGKRILIVGHGNTFRSVYGNVMGVDREEALTNKMYRLRNAELVHLPAVPLTNPLDRFIISEVQMLIAKTVNAFESYDLQQATRAIVDFMDDLTNWYIRRSRRRFWKSENDGDKMGAYETLYHVLTTLTRVMAPITPMIAEAVYHGLTGRESVHLEYFPEFARTAVSQTLQADMKRAREIITLGLALRGQKKIRVRQPLASITIGESIDAYFQEIIREELNVKEVKIEDMSAVARKICKPNAKLIGPRYWQYVQEIIRKGKAGDFIELKNPTRVQISYAWWEHWLDSSVTWLDEGEYEIAYEPLSGVSLDVMSGSGMVIAMDTGITDELETEGYARDIVRVIQDLRKEAGYEVSDRVRVALWGEKIDSVLSLFSDYIASETLSVIDNSLTEGDISREVDMEGVKVSVMVKR